MELLARYNIDTKGKRCVVLGRSNIVGKPVATLMMQKATPRRRHGDGMSQLHTRSESDNP